MAGFGFEVVKTCPDTKARAGLMKTARGVVLTPVFMPVGTQAAVKTLTPEELKAMGVELVLANTYHLYLRPGMEVIEGVGGLHRFMSWSGPMLTDSGGFQVYSLGHLRRLDDEGVCFRSHVDGSEHFLTPERIMEIQARLGADIVMALDECPPYTEDILVARRAMERTHYWLERCLKVSIGAEQALFGIVQGGMFAELRRESASFLASAGLQGYALGGLSLGEPKSLTFSLVEETVKFLPAEKPRYLMGIGSPEDLFEAIALGIDMFDCVLPTRIARNGSFLTPEGRCNVRNARFRNEKGPLDQRCDCYTCRNFSAAYVQHLFKCEELLAYRLATIHNLRFIIRLMEDIRHSILEGTFPTLKRNFLETYRPTDEETRLAQKERWVMAQQTKYSPDGGEER